MGGQRAAETTGKQAGNYAPVSDAPHPRASGSQADAD